jgi:predicted TIM-barrel fold metal-dependent hydrolase
MRAWRQVKTAASLRIVDVHAHIYVSAYLDLLAKVGLVRPRLTSPNDPAFRFGGDDEDATSRRIELMDAAGVGMQVLSPTLAPYLAEPAAAVRAASLLNDRHAAVVARHPGRLASFASLPLPYVNLALDELRRGLDVLGMAGVTMHCSCHAVSIADERFDPVFQELNRRKAVLFLHPCVNGLCSVLINDWNLAAPAGTLFEDTAIALHLMVKNIPARYPDIRIIIPHLGGALAMMLERLDNQLPLAAPGLAARPSEFARWFWYDTVSHGSRAALTCAVQAFGPDRLLPGSDFPVLLEFEEYGAAFSHIRRSGLADSEIVQILHRNMARILPDA